MSDQKKDLTGIIQYSKAMQDAGQAPPPPAGSVMEESPIEKIDEFESLDQYSLNNPVPESSQESSSEFSNNEFLVNETSAEGPPMIGETDIDSASPSTEQNQGDFPNSDFPVTSPEETPSDFNIDTQGSSDPSSVENPALQADPSEFDPIPPSDSDFPPIGEDLSSEPSSEFSTDFGPDPDVALDPAPAPQKSPADPLQLLPRAQTQPQNPTTLETLKKYSETITALAKSAVPASYPFSLMIIGKLTPQEKEKLLDIIARENMGIREIDLEVQLEEDKILIPRISEYAGIVLVQALRGASAQISLGPSDRIFATEDTRTQEDETAASVPFEDNSVSIQIDFINHPAETIPVTSDTKLPESNAYTLVDTLTATAILRSEWAEMENSDAYQSTLETLQKELKYKAYRKNSDAIIGFKIQTYPFASYSHYRIVASGTAVKYVKNSVKEVAQETPPQTPLPTEDTPTSP